MLILSLQLLLYNITFKFADQEIALESELEVRDRKNPMRNRGQAAREAHKGVIRDYEHICLVRVGAPVVYFLLRAADGITFSADNDCAK